MNYIFNFIIIVLSIAISFCVLLLGHIGFQLVTGDNCKKIYEDSIYTIDKGCYVKYEGNYIPEKIFLEKIVK